MPYVLRGGRVATRKFTIVTSLLFLASGMIFGYMTLEASEWLTRFLFFPETGVVQMESRYWQAGLGLTTLFLPFILMLMAGRKACERIERHFGLQWAKA